MNNQLNGTQSFNFNGRNIDIDGETKFYKKSEVDAVVKDLEEANKELLSALEEIKKHQYLNLGDMAKLSTTWNIADKAIAKHEVGG